MFLSTSSRTEDGARLVNREGGEDMAESHLGQILSGRVTGLNYD